MFHVSRFIVVLCWPMSFEFQILDRHSALKFIFLSATVSHPGPEVAKQLGFWGFNVGVQSFAFSKQNTVCIYPKVKLLCHVSAHSCLSSATLMHFIANPKRTDTIYLKNNGFFVSSFFLQLTFYQTYERRCHGYNTLLCHVILVHTILGGKSELQVQTGLW